jgi:fused signal recognition particle receptor
VVLLVVVVVVAAALAVGILLALALRTPPDASRVPVEEAPPPPRAPAPDADALVAPSEAPAEAPPEAPPRLRDRIGRTRAAIAGYVRDLAGRGDVDEATFDELEEALLLADVGVATTQRLLAQLRERVERDRVADVDTLLAALRDEVTALLDPALDRSLCVVPGEPNVWMFVGVNGVGKTTTIGKLAAQQAAAGHRAVLAAGDTFRAAAAEQLATWAERAGAELVRGQDGADPGSIVFDAMAAAGARRADLVLVDTAGRLHTKHNLMEELQKLRRIVQRTDGALKEVLLVVDATTGQNGLVQAREFAQAVDVTGVVLTKLDGTAKGGIVLAIQGELGIPVKLVGLGEGLGDLVAFDPAEFAGALFGAEEAPDTDR